MISFQSYAQDQLSTSLVESIAALKATSWNYPLESQIEWIRTRARHDDVHLLATDGQVYCAYLRLVVRSTKQLIPFSGLSTVVVRPEYRHKGLGLKLVEEANGIISNRHHFGLLCCQAKLKSFYGACHWVLTDNTILNEKNKPFFADEVILTYGDALLDKTTYVNGEAF